MHSNKAMELNRNFEREESAISMSDLLLRENSYSIVSDEPLSTFSTKIEGSFQNIPPRYHNFDRISRSSSINTTSSSQVPLVEIKSSVKPNMKRILKRVLVVANICTIIGLSVALIVVSNQNNSDEENGNDKQNKGSTTLPTEDFRSSPTGMASERSTQTHISQGTLSTVKTGTHSSLSTAAQSTLSIIDTDTSPAISTVTQETVKSTINSRSSASSGSTKPDQSSSTMIVTEPSDSSTSSFTSTTKSSTTPRSSFGTWLQWGTWTGCSASCGLGIHFRYRACDKVVLQNTVCAGNYVQVESCLSTTCTEYGFWTLWSSWSDCDVSCNGGVQSRQRNCNKTAPAVNCDREIYQRRQCSFWNCPDCSAICEEGALSPSCDMCMCNMTKQGHVRTSLNETVLDAAIFLNGSHSTAIAISKDFGKFSTDVVCDNTIIYAEKSGYSTSVCRHSSEEIICYVTKNEKPNFYEQPQPKARLEGENVTLCCSASSSPDVDYYEWMIEHVMLDESLYPNGKTLQMTNLSMSDSGQYKCRANSGAGNMMSEEASLIIRGTENEFCENSLGQRTIHLPDDCIQPMTMTASYEVGYCNRQLCRKSNISESGTCRDDSQNCCTVSEYDINTVFCTGYNLSVLSVKACGCGVCSFDEVRIVGTVFYYGTNEHVRFGLVYLNGIFQTYTSSKGLFKLSVDQRFGSAVITIINDVYQTTKVIDVSEGTTGTLYINMYIVKETCSFQINATEQNVIHIGNCEQDVINDNSFLFMDISAFSFLDSSFNIFNGIVKVNFTFLNGTHIPEVDIMPGALLSVNEEGEKVHITSFGAFRVAFYDLSSLTPLKIGKNINVVSKVTSDLPVNVFALQISNGLWYPIGDEVPIKLIEPDFKSWLNLGTYVNASIECFFNIRIYEDFNHLSEITNSKFQLFIQALHFDSHRSFETYHHTFSTSRTCFKTICTEMNGYIEVWMSNFEKNTAEYLLPAISSDTGLSLAQQHLISYSARTFDPHLGLRFKVSSNGPFFDSQNSCFTKTQDGNHFKFHFQNISEDVYTFRHFNDLSSQNARTIDVVSKKVWYPKRQEGHRVCFVKIRFVLTTIKNVKVRVTSYGGTYKNISNEILGIRETHISNSSTVCLEYKCSGTINEENAENNFDETKVKIQYFSSIPMDCAIDSFSEELISEFSEINPQPKNGDAFIFHAPTTSSPSLGIYSATTSSEDIETAKSSAKKECQSGIPMDIYANNPEIGTAVIFSCD